MSRRHGRHCGCHSCQQTIVHPTKYNCVNQYSQSQVTHVHPSHTTVMNHHTVNNHHVFPHSTSVQNTTNSVDTYGGSFEVPAPGQVAGAMSPGAGQGFGPGFGPGGQVAGAMSPGFGQGGPGGQVAGAQSPGYGSHHWKKHNKWC